jgi:hypothetical protein
MTNEQKTQAFNNADIWTRYAIMAAALNMAADRGFFEVIVPSNIPDYINREKARLKEEAYAIGWAEYFSNRVAELNYKP